MNNNNNNNDPPPAEGGAAVHPVVIEAGVAGQIPIGGPPAIQQPPPPPLPQPRVSSHPLRRARQNNNNNDNNNNNNPENEYALAEAAVAAAAVAAAAAPRRPPTNRYRGNNAAEHDNNNNDNANNHNNNNNDEGDEEEDDIREDQHGDEAAAVERLVVRLAAGQQNQNDDSSNDNQNNNNHAEGGPVDRLAAAAAALRADPVQRQAVAEFANAVFNNLPQHAAVPNNNNNNNDDNNNNNQNHINIAAAAAAVNNNNPNNNLAPPLPNNETANSKKSTQCDYYFRLENLDPLTAEGCIGSAVGTRISIGLHDKSTILIHLFQRYLEFLNRSSSAVAATKFAAAAAAAANNGDAVMDPPPPPQMLTMDDVEFVHNDILDGNETAEGCALMKEDTIHVRIKRDAERAAVADKQRLQKMLDKDFVMSLREALLLDGSSTAVGAQQQIAASTTVPDKGTGRLANQGTIAGAVAATLDAVGLGGLAAKETSSSSFCSRRVSWKIAPPIPIWQGGPDVALDCRDYVHPDATACTSGFGDTKDGVVNGDDELFQSEEGVYFEENEIVTEYSTVVKLPEDGSGSSQNSSSSSHNSGSSKRDKAERRRHVPNKNKASSAAHVAALRGIPLEGNVASAESSSRRAVPCDDDDYGIAASTSTSTRAVRSRKSFENPAAAFGTGVNSSMSGGDDNNNYEQRRLSPNRKQLSSISGCSPREVTTTRDNHRYSSNINSISPNNNDASTDENNVLFGHYVIIAKRCQWLKKKIDAAREDNKRKEEVANTKKLEEQNEEEHHDKVEENSHNRVFRIPLHDHQNASVSCSPSVRQVTETGNLVALDPTNADSSGSNRSCLAKEDNDGQIVLVGSYTTAQQNLNHSVLSNDDESGAESGSSNHLLSPADDVGKDDDDIAAGGVAAEKHHIIEQQQEMDEGKESVAKPKKSTLPQALYVTLTDHPASAYRILLEYIYTNRVKSLGRDAFELSTKNSVSPPAYNGRWPQRGLPTIGMSTCLAGLRLAEDASLPRLSYMCEIAASRIVDRKTVLMALSECTHHSQRSGNSLDVLRNWSMRCVLNAPLLKELGGDPHFMKGLKSRGDMVVPALLQGTRDVCGMVVPNSNNSNNNNNPNGSAWMGGVPEFAALSANNHGSYNNHGGNNGGGRHYSRRKNSRNSSGNNQNSRDGGVLGNLGGGRQTLFDKTDRNDRKARERERQLRKQERIQRQFETQQEQQHQQTNPANNSNIDDCNNDVDIGGRTGIALDEFADVDENSNTTSGGVARGIRMVRRTKSRGRSATGQQKHASSSTSSRNVSDGGGGIGSETRNVESGRSRGRGGRDRSSGAWVLWRED